MWEILNATVKESMVVREPSPPCTQQTVKSGKEEVSSTTDDKQRRRRPQKKPAAERKVEETPDSPGRRKKIKWPKANSEEWRKLDTDLTMILKEVGNTPEAKAKHHPDIIYRIALERFGEESAGKKSWKAPTRVTKSQQLRKEIKELNNEYYEAPEREKQAIQELQAERLKQLRLQKREEAARQKRKKTKEYRQVLQPAI